MWGSTRCGRRSTCAAAEQWVSSAGLGTMGFGLPAAIGVQVALMDEQVVCIAGDASVLMNIKSWAPWRNTACR